jgi:methyl-accepting chemotaxis protein
MSFNDALAHQIIWKRRLEKWISGELINEPLESSTVRKDDACELGQWIYGEGSRYNVLPAYENLVKKHANFHVWAADLVKKVEDGDHQGAQAVMQAGFDARSREIFNALNELRQAVVAEKII